MVSLVLRCGCGLALLILIYCETGIWTAGLLAGLLIANEISVWQHRRARECLEGLAIGLQRLVERK